ncbi:MAG: hypothetical protein ABIJ85_00525 [bacterium]
MTTFKQRVLKSISLDKESSVLKNFFIYSLSINVLAIASVFIGQSFLPPQVPLYYGLPEGESQLANSLGLVIPSTVSLLILTVNFILIKMLKEDYLKKILATVSLVASVFAIITTIKIIFLVGSF